MVLRPLTRIPWIILGGLLLCFPHRLLAQEGTRAAEIEAARQAKSGALAPVEPSKGDRALEASREERILERFATGVAGFRPRVGWLVSNSRIAIGPEYLRQDLAGGSLMLRTAAQVSFRNYHRYDLQLTSPRAATDKVFFDFFAVHHNYPGVNYYGPGPNSLKISRTNYRLEDRALDLAAGVHPIKRLSIGASAGYLWVNVGPGGDARFASSDQVFSPAQSPGIDRQTDFCRYGFFTQVDYRDDPRVPRAGGSYAVRYNRYLDQNLGLFSFNRFDAEVRQLVPLFNKSRVIALRAKTALTDPVGNNQVPFYLQPTVGGSDDVRGFRQFRFRDNNMFVVNGEWRWEALSGLDMAAFYDAGKVFPRRSQLNFHGLEQSAGFGFRFDLRGYVFVRADVGFSREGTMVWFRFGNVFRDERLRSTPLQ